MHEKVKAPKGRSAAEQMAETAKQDLEKILSGVDEMSVDGSAPEDPEDLTPKDVQDMKRALDALTQAEQFAGEPAGGSDWRQDVQKKRKQLAAQQMQAQEQGLMSDVMSGMNALDLADAAEKAKLLDEAAQLDDFDRNTGQASGDLA